MLAVGANHLALGRGVAAGCSHPDVAGVDQRGVARPATGCTSGAYQRNETTNTQMKMLTGIVVGDGRITSAGMANCTAAGNGTDACRGWYGIYADVPLNAVPSSGHAFVGWSGDCSGVEPSTLVQMWGADRTCTARFEPIRDLNVQVTTDGGYVYDYHSVPERLVFTRINSCSNDGWGCNGRYAGGSTVTLTASPSPGWVFKEWQGDGCNAVAGNPLQAAVHLDQNRTCRASFMVPPMFSLTVDVLGNGFGNVDDRVLDYYGPGGIRCGHYGNDCSRNYPVGTQVTLTATPILGSVFTGWGGDCAAAGNDPQATVVSLDEAALMTCTATFEPGATSYPLTVTVNGNGMVEDNPGNYPWMPPPQIACSPAFANCTGYYAANSETQLHAAPDAGHRFTGWGGACAAAGDAFVATVTMDAAKNCTATFAAAAATKHTLTVTVNGAGGKVRDQSTPRQIENCTSAGGANCSGDYDEGVTVLLVPEPAAGNTFQGWTGDGCVLAFGNLFTVAVNMNQARHCTATFAPTQENTLTVTVIGNGSVRGEYGGIQIAECRSNSGTCTASYPDNKTALLLAAPDGNHTFVGWEGDCTAYSDTQPHWGRVSMDQNRACTARFEEIGAPTRWLTVHVIGAGGSVTDSGAPPQINACTWTGGPNCSGGYPEGTNIALTATPTAGHEFSHWSGAGCTIGGNPVLVMMNETRSCTATFSAIAPATHTLTVNAGVGGSVSAFTGAIADCTSAGGVCTGDYVDGAIVTLMVTEAPDYIFANWGGACTADPDDPLLATVLMTQARTCSVTFTPPVPLAVTVNGDGSVMDNLGKIFGCTAAGGAACSGNYVLNSEVFLYAEASPNNVFTGWGGACAAAGNADMAEVTMSQARSCTATFAPAYRLEVDILGDGDGKVNDNAMPQKIFECGAFGGRCIGDYVVNTSVTLTAAADAVSRFVGWGGACAAAGNAATATVTMNQAHTCEATFELVMTMLTLSVTGDGGSISDNAVPRQIDACTSAGGANCSGIYLLGANIALTASPNAGFAFDGWTGDCAASGRTRTASVTMNTALSCGAAFVAAPMQGGTTPIPTLGHLALLLLIAALGMGAAFHPGIRRRVAGDRQ
ncbi:MAG: hypothetical protein FWC38_07175 [Proteobacteria bacterium]|nr:hypothetical protein [Pseudomonadota bacterium]MCL2307985.1 hypothetical protein [Pseudomonadota bacterium]